ncbi:MAG: Malto-oligosyltrehalose trehalohydrolase [Myxococcaceae bacterium]|nr:Malto-oligosyltrehalose trehalohydrolase [Myxococcaceae bacterium]
MRRLPGAHPAAAGTTFVAWTTTARAVDLRLFDDAGRVLRTEALQGRGDGWFEKHLEGVKEGALYKLVLDGAETPDPYARFLPSGIHGPARVVAPARVEPLSEPPPPSQWVIYELHVGTFSPEGTYRGAEQRLDAIAETGFTAIEILPVAAFPGERGWGYDGVALYAPYAPYGDPDDLRALIRAAHRRGLAVVLDVVYNHFGPSGNYLWRYAPEYFTKAVETPWGPAPDFAHEPMRRLVVDNARYWLEEFGVDGLRLDATHAIHDPSEIHVLREITDLAHAMKPARRVFFEDERNEPDVVKGLGADGVWADDFHHQLHVLLTRERDGYYAAYDGTVEALALAINDGWTFTGQPFPPWNCRPRGRSPRAHGVEPQNLLYCIQNHDQVGNRALGTRLSQDVDVDAYCAASALLLFLPATPLVFMGQEWAASSPFLFFSDHEGELGEAVRKGRREEFKTFAAFADPAVRDRIPDPQAESTFERSKLRWDERAAEPHARVLALYRAMLALRRSDPVLSAKASWADFEARAQGDVLEVVRRNGAASRRLIVTFGDGEHVIEGGEGARVLFASGRFEGGRLAARGAVVLAVD